MNILQINTFDIAGGAEKVAWNLFQVHRAQGHNSWLAVGHKRSTDPNIFIIPNERYRHYWAQANFNISARLTPLCGRIPGASRLQQLLRQLGEPMRWWTQMQGQEDFYFPGTRRLLKLPPNRPAIVHCHNLHGGYFDLRALPWLSSQLPVILTLHDAWLLSGHCAHSFECTRWQNGCGSCPDLLIYPAIKRDRTAFNWQQKQRIFSKSQVYISTPSYWLMNKVQQSMLMSGSQECRVIPNGVNLATFRSVDKNIARATIGISTEAKILLFAANGIRQNRWKDYRMMQESIVQVSQHFQDNKIIFIALGEEAPSEHIGRAEVRFVPYQKDEEAVAQYYQAADVYLHAARIDTFPNTVIEALACGTPVVATAVGGIPEQIDHGKNGLLVSPGNSEAMANCIIEILSNKNLQMQMSENAVNTAKNRFSLTQQANSYLEWYREILNKQTNQRKS